MNISLILQLLKFLPTLISLVETIHPPSATGAQKLAAVTSMVTAAVPATLEAANAADASGQNTLGQVISGVVAGMNAAGIMPEAGSNS